MRPILRRAFFSLLLALSPLAGHAQGSGGQDSGAGPTVFGAASLTDALRDIATAWQQAGHPAPRLVFGASSTLARQIEQGAPANLFASADEQWMDYLAQRNLLAPETRRDLLRNDLVLVMPTATAHPVTIAPGMDLASLLGPNGRIATGDPAHVPVGLYAHQALEKLGLWTQAQPRIAAAEDVRGALLLVARGEAPAGIVYSTDAAAADGVRVVGTFPADSHDPITYPFALTRQANPEATALLAFLSTPAASAIFAKRGFGVISTAGK